MGIDLRTGIEIVRLYGPLWLQLAFFALASASHVIATFSVTEAYGGSK